MEPLFVAFFFLLGLIVGSFINSLVFRYGTGSVLSSRSICFSCGAILRWFELIPILSFFVLKRRCRRCGSSFSLQYPAVEILTGVIFVLAYLHHLITLAGLYFLFIFSLLMFILVYDLRHKIIPNAPVYTFIALSFITMFFDLGELTFSSPDLLHILSGVILFLFFLSLWIFSRGRWVGLGDGKLALGVGWSLGFAGGVTALALSFWIGAIVGLSLLFFQKVAGKSKLISGGEKLTMKTEIPFAPFLILAFSIVHFFSFSLFVL